jgi:hypothetical protein
MRAFGCHDSRDARRAQDIAFLGIARPDEAECLGPHANPTLGDGYAIAD